MHRLLPLLLFSLWSLLAATPNAQYLIHTECGNNTNYTPGSAFQTNLEALLSSLLSATAASGGFSKNVTGDTPNQAFGLAQCRGDVSATDCSNCLGKLAHDLHAQCIGQKSAIIFSESCLLRHSNESFFGVANSLLLATYSAVKNVTQPELFGTQVTALMNDLKGKAAYDTPRRFAVGMRDLTPVKIYGMAQCTRDLTAEGCYSCLDGAVVSIPTYWKDMNREGCQIIHWSCFIRFESSLFYNSSAAEVAMSSPALAPGDGGYSNHSSQGSTGRIRTVRITLLVSVPLAVTQLVLLLFVVYICKKRKPQEHVKVPSNGHENKQLGSLETLQYTLSALKAATENFSEQNRLGQGSFGPVYRGKLHNGQAIAVKRLATTSHQGQAEMKNEVALVAKLQHKNLVRLLGYCIEKHESLLVYEFLTNKSLDKILYDPEKRWELSWKQRYKIIDGIGRGLIYLHEDSRFTIIHRDLKPGNILLDIDMNPKISDFGLAKMFQIDLSVANTCHVAGTRGYMAPEYILNGIFSAKSDVFSYGVLILEVVIGRRPSEDLLKFVWRLWSQGNLTPLLDSCPSDEPGKQQMLRCIHVALLCVQDDPDFRPRTAAVLHMLNSHYMMLPAPTEPVFAATGESHISSGLKRCINESSISDVEPR